MQREKVTLTPDGGLEDREAVVGVVISHVLDAADEGFGGSIHGWILPRVFQQDEPPRNLDSEPRIVAHEWIPHRRTVKSGVEGCGPAAVDRIGCSSYPFRTIYWISVSHAHGKRVALRNVEWSRLACQCSLKPAG